MKLFANTWPWKIMNLLPQKQQIAFFEKRTDTPDSSLSFSFSPPSNPCFFLGDNTYAALRFLPLLESLPTSNVFCSLETQKVLQTILPNLKIHTPLKDLLYGSPTYTSWIESIPKDCDIVFILTENLKWIHQLTLSHLNAPLRVGYGQENLSPWINLELKTQNIWKYSFFIQEKFQLPKSKSEYLFLDENDNFDDFPKEQKAVLLKPTSEYSNLDVKQTTISFTQWLALG